MLGITYGFQASIFIIKQEFMLISGDGFFSPIYSFWCKVDFFWENTRIDISDGGNKKVVMNEDERFHQSMIPLKKFSDKSFRR
ncbi:hypothetical protein AZE42_09030 [Rhizopogon vesiculosus]|uniref:Uncharacterized protein n=1 Tax=Rhizopogon vesiculosus TaxID=180088 RepID=A0A1J8QWU0_9AGAM|nr:hypothetical protein AZE42_09030 [Rhizopogon vesiculosus]